MNNQLTQATGEEAVRLELLRISNELRQVKKRQEAISTLELQLQQLQEQLVSMENRLFDMEKKTKTYNVEW